MKSNPRATRQPLATFGALIIFGLGIAGCAESPTADTIYLGGEIVTMEGETPQYVAAVAVKDGTILFAGDEDGALSVKSGDTRIVDLDGKTLEWGRRQYVSKLGAAAERVELIQRDVLAAPRPRADVVAALNFS